MADYINLMMRIAEVNKGKPLPDEVPTDFKLCFEYPDFTPEKQLEIIKLILLSFKHKKDLNHPLGFSFRNNNYIILDSIYDTYDGIEIGREIENQDFSQALALLTVKLIDERELDKEKVKKILEQ